MVFPTHIVTRQSTDIYANNDPHIAEVLRYIHENISLKISVDESGVAGPAVAPPAGDPVQEEHGHVDLRLYHSGPDRKDDAAAVRRA